MQIASEYACGLVLWFAISERTATTDTTHQLFILVVPDFIMGRIFLSFHNTIFVVDELISHVGCETVVLIPHIFHVSFLYWRHAVAQLVEALRSNLNAAGSMSVAFFN
jgi:hypothetical protein